MYFFFDLCLLLPAIGFRCGIVFLIPISALGARDGTGSMDGWTDGWILCRSILSYLVFVCLWSFFFFGGLGRLRKGCIHTAWSRQALCMMNDDYENAGVHGRYK